MPKAGRKTYYWDTVSFIAWLNGGLGHPREVIEGLEEIAKEVSQNRANLCTSVITKTEILEGKLKPEEKTRLDNLFKRRNVVLINLDERIATLAGEIRNYYRIRDIRIATPDSIHLATAVIYEVDELHTLDGSGPRQRPSDMLRLNGNVAGHSLHIRVPTAAQTSLLTGVGPMELDEKKSGGESVKQPEKTEPSTTELPRGSDGVPESPAPTEKVKIISAETTLQSEEKQQVDKEKGPPSL